MTVRHLAAVTIIVLLTLISTSVRPAAMQTAATGRVMREKLIHAQKLLEALTTSNFTLLENESLALSRLTNDLGWMVLKTPEYRKQSESFLRTTEALVSAARARDMDLAAMQYMSMTMSCYQCHRYMKNMRIATKP